MKTSLVSASFRRPLALGCFASLVFSTAAWAAEKPEHSKGDAEGTVVAWKDVPAAIQEAIKHEAGDAEVVKVELEHRKKGDVYEAEVRKTDGSLWELRVRPDGKAGKLRPEKDGEEAGGDKAGKKKDKKHAHGDENS